MSKVKAFELLSRAKEHLNHKLHLPNHFTASTGIGVGLRLARAYRRLPSVQRLQQDFDCSRATAYRWRAAMADAGWRAS